MAKNPQVSVYKYWTTQKGNRTQLWRLCWHFGPPTANGETPRYTKGGFGSQRDAFREFERTIKPALDAGYPTPQARDEAEYAERPTLAQAIDRYLTEWKMSVRDKTYVDRKQTLERARDILGQGKLLDDITTRSVSEFVTLKTRKGEPSPCTKHNRHLYLRLFFDWAVENRLCKVNPCRRIKLQKPTQGRLRFLAQAECKLLLDACLKVPVRHVGRASPEFIRAFVASGIFIGARLDELCHLEWTDLDWENCWVTIQSKPEVKFYTKNGKNRVLGVNPEFFEILRQYRESREEALRRVKLRIERLEIWKDQRGDAAPGPELMAGFLENYKQPPSVNLLLQKARGLMRSLQLQIRSPLVFPNQHGKRYKGPPNGYDKAVRLAGLKGSGVCFHTLRHTFGSHLVMNGVDLSSVRDLMGHKDIMTTMTYAHLAPNHALAAAAKIPSMLKTEPTEPRDAQVLPVHRN